MASGGCAGGRKGRSGECPQMAAALGGMTTDGGGRRNGRRRVGRIGAATKLAWWASPIAVCIGTARTSDAPLHWSGKGPPSPCSKGRLSGPAGLRLGCNWVWGSGDSAGLSHQHPGHSSSTYNARADRPPRTTAVAVGLPDAARNARPGRQHALAAEINVAGRPRSSLHAEPRPSTSSAPSRPLCTCCLLTL